MPSVYASQEDCNSVLGKKMQYWRADRPDEWLMDEFIREVEKLDSAVQAAKAVLALFPEDMKDDGSGMMGFKPESIEAVEKLREILLTSSDI